MKSRATKRWKEVTAMAVCNCVDEIQTSSISLSHSLRFRLPPLAWSFFSLRRPKIMRSVPSQGPFQIKPLCVSPLIPSCSLFPCPTSRLPRDRPAPRRSHIRPCAVCNSPPGPHKEVFMLLNASYC